MDEIQHLFSELANQANDVLWLFSHDWDELVFVSDAYEDIYGQSRETLEENPRAFLDAIHPDDRDYVKRAMEELSDGQSVDIEYRVNEAEDYECYVWIKADPIIDADGTVTHIGGFTRDITERKEREHELERMRDLFDKTERIADVGGWEIDTDTMAVFWTENLFDLLEVDSEEEPPLEEALAVYHEDDRPIIENAVERALNDGESFDVDAWFQTPDDEIRWLRVQGVPTIDDGDVVTLRGAAQDITDRKKYQQKLERQNERLDEFASIVSHDLRNPLNVANGRLELAREECDSGHLDNVAREHERMNALIDDLLTMAREGDRAHELESIDLAEFTQQCWQHIATAEATLVITTDTTIQADRSRLQQLLENLLRNAVEHGGRNVTVTVGDLKNGFYLEDDGTGMSEETREEAFNPGYSTAEDGTGSGLPIAKQVTNAHGWEIRLTDSSDGLRVEITGITSTR